MITKDNPIHRMKDIMRERTELALKLAPFYAALDLVGGPSDVESLEHIPAFREPWLRMRELQEEYDKNALVLALTWELHPIPVDR